MKIIEVTSKKLLRDFIKLPFEIHKDHKLWVPPLLADEKLYFDQNKNIAFKKNETVLLVVIDDQKCVGRVMGIINSDYNQKQNELTARFGFLDYYKNENVFNVLMESVESWARNKGMNKIVGPMGFSDQDPEGFIIEGYDLEPSIATYFNYEYIPIMLESKGYSKEVDYVVYLIDLNKPIPSIHKKIFQRFIERTNLKLLTFTSKRELKPFIVPIMHLMNETFANLYGYNPLTQEEIDFTVKRFWPLINPRFVFAAEDKSQLVGFIIGIPNMNEGFRACKGKLFPFGISKLISAAKKSKQLDLLIAGIKSEYRGMGLDVWGMISMINSAKKAGFTLMDSHHELETNTRVRVEMERIGGTLEKRFRIYKKLL